MTKKGKFLAVADLRGRFNFTVPKKVRQELNFDEKAEIMSLSFNLEPTGEITFGKGGENIIDSTAISGTYQATLTKKPRQRLQANKDGTIVFYVYEKNKRVLVEMIG